MAGAHDIDADDPHTRAVLNQCGALIIPLVLMGLTGFFVPGQDIFTLRPAFFWIFSALTWVGWLGWSPLLIVGIITIYVDLEGFSGRTKLRWRFLFRRLVALLAWLFIAWLVALCSIWLSLVAFLD